MTSAPASNRPSFILFMTDQQRGDCLSLAGHPALLTPNMDHIGAGGAFFRRGYSTCPSCIPARRSLLSGQFPFTNQMVGYQEKVPWEPAATLPGELQKAGYQTAIVGRNMHQYAPDNHFGFEWIGNDYGKYLAANAPAASGGSWGHGISGNGWTARPWHLAEHLHYSHWVVNEALDFLARHDRTRPFFLVISFIAPHPPLVPPAFYLERYLRLELPAPAIGDWAESPPNNGLGLRIESDRVNLQGEALRACRAGYYGLINHLDDQFYRVLGRNPHVDWANTYTMLTADHGEMLGDHYLFRKCYPYEGSARIPFLMRGPQIKPGVVCDQPVCLEDFMPTVLELAGVAVPRSVEGASLVPILRGEDVQVRAVLHGEHATCYRQEQANHFLTDGRFKYVWFSHTGEEHLFDLERDPLECHDLLLDPRQLETGVLWRQRLIERLKDRPEGFTDGQSLIAGQPHTPVPPVA